MSQRARLAAVGLGGMGVGWALAQLDRSSRERVLPSGARTCCDGAPLTAEQLGLTATLRQLVGKEHVSEGVAMRGSRIGRGTALAVIRPSSLADAALALRACADAGVAIVPQGANTGLTGGSVPRDAGDRPTVVLSMRGLAGSRAVDGNKRVLCLAGTGIADLAKALRGLGRESHSVLGSIFLNPSVGAGVAFGSGGTQLRKGPVYTERGLYLAVSAEGEVQLVNELGIEGLADGRYGLDEEGLALLRAVQQLCQTQPQQQQQQQPQPQPQHAREQVQQPAVAMPAVGDGLALALRSTAASGPADPAVDPSADAATPLRTAAGCSRAAHAREYGRRVASLDDGVSRFNADTSGPAYVRSEGKVLLLASVHETFAQPRRKRVLCLSVSSLQQAHELKRALLAPPDDGSLPMDALLPASIEYLDSDTVAVVDRAGRALICALGLVGVDSGALALGWRLKSALEALPLPLAPVLADSLLYYANALMPDPLPPAVRRQAAQYGHHLLVELCDYGRNEDTLAVARIDAFVRQQEQARAEAGGGAGAGSAGGAASDEGAEPAAVCVYECPTGREGLMLNRFRFAVAPAFRTWCVGQGQQGLSLDYALPKSCSHAPPLPPGVQPTRRLRYSHFGCNVFHEDLAFGPDADVHAAKRAIKRTVEQLGGKLPAEHGHGTEYVAPRETQARWMAMDPTNTMNPGIGGLSDCRDYRCERGREH